MSDERQQDTSSTFDASLDSPKTDILATSLPARVTPYRSLSAKRPRDPSHRKSVSFNDVPIVHEVPSHDAMRNSNCASFRSWTYTDATPSTPNIQSYNSPQIISPFGPTITTTTTTTTTTTAATAANQKPQLHRLNSGSLYSSLATNTTASRMPDWAIRSKSVKVNASVIVNANNNINSTSNNPNSSTTDESTTNQEQNNNSWLTPTIILHTPDERNNKETSGKTLLSSTYNNTYLTHNQSVSTQVSVNTGSTNISDNVEEKKYPYRTALIPDTEHHRTLPFTYEHVSDSTATYTTMLSTHLASPSHPVSNDQSTNTSYVRSARIRSATLPISVNHSGPRGTDTISITPFRNNPSNLSINGSSGTSRAILRPTTIAFQYTQPITANNTLMGANSSTTSTTSGVSNNGSTILMTSMMNPANTNTSSFNSTTINNSPSKPPIAPSRFASAAVSTSSNHSRLGISPNRPFPNAALVSPNIKYTFAHQNTDSTLINTSMPTSNGTVTKSPPTPYPRSRSATVLSSRRHAASASNQTNENHSTTHTTNSGISPGSTFYGTSKRNPNVRQNYGSYYMHRVLLPTSIN